MSISTNKKTLVLAASAALTAGLALSPMLASAETSPFASAELSNGYMQLAGHHEAAEAKCGEGKCGADKAAEKVEEAKCGEGKCGEGKCGAKDAAAVAAEKAAEAKCGEGKCGAK